VILDVCTDNRIAYYWLSKEERDNQELRESLQPEYKEWKNKGYKVCVFLSGDGDLVKSTKELLIHNKEVLAKKMIKREREHER